MAEHLIVDLATGEPSTRPETAEEAAEKAANLALQQQAEQQQAATTAERTAASADLQGTYQQAVTRLDAIIAAGSTLTAAQTRDAVVDVARILRRTLRLVKAQL